jgi:hypothetical protein
MDIPKGIEHGSNSSDGCEISNEEDTPMSTGTEPEDEEDVNYDYPSHH